MNTSGSPPLPPEAAEKKIRRLRGMLFVLLILFCLVLVFGIVIPALKGVSMFDGLVRGAQLNINASKDTFRVQVLEVESRPGFFRERLRVRCEKGMNAGLWVSDIKTPALITTRGPNGEVLWRDGEPHKTGQTVPVRAEGEFSTCEFFFTATTTASNTVWHSDHADSTLDTTFEIPMAVSSVQTNWPGYYEKGTSLPLAHLGDYHILLTIK